MSQLSSSSGQLLLSPGMPLARPKHQVQELSPQFCWRHRRAGPWPSVSVSISILNVIIINIVRISLHPCLSSVFTGSNKIRWTNLICVSTSVSLHQSSIRPPSGLHQTSIILHQSPSVLHEASIRPPSFSISLHQSFISLHQSP